MKVFITTCFLISQIMVFSQQVLLPDETGNNLYFGWSMDSDEDRLIVGSPGTGVSRGISYIYERVNEQWILEQKLVNNPGQWSGYDVGIDGLQIIEGAGLNSSGSSRSANVYNFNQNESFEFIENYKEFIDFFGNTVDIDGELMAIGGSLGDHNENNLQTGTVALYSVNGGTIDFIDFFYPDDSAVSESFFAEALAIDNNFIAIGSYGYHNFDGAVFIISNINGSWETTQTINTLSGNGFSQFGESVSMTEDFLAIGCPRDSINYSNSGSVYLYENMEGTFVFHSKVTPNEENENDLFGFSVELFDNYLIVGAPNYDGDNIDQGAGYLYKFENGQWNQERLITIPGANGSAQFGHSTSINNSHLFLGGPGFISTGSCTGAVYYEEID